MRPRLFASSIRFRVTLATTTVVTITLATGAVVLVILLRQLLIGGLDSSQTARAIELSSQARTGLVTGTIPGSAVDTSLVLVVSSNGVVVASTSNISGESPILSSFPLARGRIALTISDAPLDTGAPFRVIAEPVSLPQGQGWIYVASSLGQVDTAVNQLTTLFLVAIPVAILLIAAIGWLAVRQSLRPVESIRRRAAAITSADLSQRVPIPSGSDEIAHLATTMNDMLSRIEHAAKRQREFMGMHLTSYAARLPPYNSRWMSRCLNRMNGSFRDLSRMLRNLGDNAHDHAESSIEMTLARNDGYAEIIVVDDGGGIGEADRERIFARFSRLDDSRVRDTRGGGSGLGLAISRRIAESSGGTLTARIRSDGRRGAEFVVQLPFNVDTP
ncbi:MAG: ATP-binding protein [Actinomycetota bacterium]